MLERGTFPKLVEYETGAVPGREVGGELVRQRVGQRQQLLQRHRRRVHALLHPRQLRVAVRSGHVHQRLRNALTLSALSTTPATRIQGTHVGRLTSRFGRASHTSTRDRRPRTFWSTALRRASSNLRVAALWNTTDTCGHRTRSVGCMRGGAPDQCTHQYLH